MYNSLKNSLTMIKNRDIILLRIIVCYMRKDDEYAQDTI